jgi:hypothetical protein
MPLRTVFEALGNFLNWTLELVPFLGNLPNLLFSLVIAGGTLYWLREMRKHQQAGEK